MTERNRTTPRAQAARVATAGVLMAGGALLMAAHATAEPVEPVPAPPGQPVAGPPPAPIVPPPPPPGPPPVPQMANPVYGQGNSGSPFGYLGDIWRAARSGDPVGALAGGPAGAPAPPPPGAGPAPALPPGFVSMTAPESTTSPGERSSAEAQPGGPPLPEGYHPLSGPPPPGWYDGPAADPAAPIFPAPPAPGAPAAPPAPIFPAP